MHIHAVGTLRHRVEAMTITQRWLGGSCQLQLEPGGSAGPRVVLRLLPLQMQLLCAAVEARQSLEAPPYRFTYHDYLHEWSVSSGDNTFMVFMPHACLTPLRPLPPEAPEPASPRRQHLPRRSYRRIGFAFGLVWWVVQQLAPVAAVGLMTACGDEDEPGQAVEVDADGDGYTFAEDCDDSDPAVHPEAVEVCNSRDDDCDSWVDDGLPRQYVVYFDGDQDGYGGLIGGDVCAPDWGAPWYTAVYGDCNDEDPSVHPGALEACGDGDRDCDGEVKEGC